MKHIHKNRQSGASLIEVLAALIIVTVGMLGVIGLQMESVLSNKRSFYRTQATGIANDILNKMRSNIIAVENGTYQLSYGSTVTETDCSAAICDANALAEYDKYIWLENLNEVLPYSNAMILPLDAPDNKTWSILVEYTEDRDLWGTGSTSPRCATLGIYCLYFEARLH